MTFPPYGPPGWPGLPPGYNPTPGHPPGYNPIPIGWKPGIIPLRPLSWSDIFNGAVAYVRANPKATLGLTTAIVVVTSLLSLGLTLAPSPIPGNAGLAAGAATGAIATALATVLLSGMLTVVVARAVFGSPITAAEAWRKVRGRLAALIGLSLLEIVAAVVLIAAVVMVIAGVAVAVNAVAATLVGIPLVLLGLAALAYLFTVLSFAPVTVVLELKSVPDSVRRSWGLARNRFWRILGIRFLAGVVAVVVGAAVSVPFEIIGQVLSFGANSGGPTIAAAVVVTVGSAIGQIITTPFTAGVVVLLYVDARIRAEAFDFTLHAAAIGGNSPDDAVWLTGYRQA